MSASWSKKYRMGNATATQRVSLNVQGQNSENFQMNARDLNVYQSNSNSGAPPNLKQKVESTGNFLGARGAVVAIERASIATLGGNAVIANAKQVFTSKVMVEASENFKLSEKQINTAQMTGNAVMQGQLAMKSDSEVEGKGSTNFEKHASDGNTLEMLGNGGLENEPVMDAVHTMKMEGAKNPANVKSEVERQNVIRHIDPVTGIVHEEVMENGQNLGQGGQNLFEDD